MTSAAVSRTVLASFLGLAILVAGTVQGDSPAKGKVETTKKDGKDAKSGERIPKTITAPAEPEHVQAMELQYANPEDVRQTLASVWAELMSLRGVTAKGKAPRLAADPRTRTLFVRGTSQEVEVVSDLVAVLDTAPGKAVPEVKGIQVIRLKSAKLPDVVKILGELGLQGKIVQLPKLNTLILPANGADTREAQNVIDKLESARTPETSKKPEKKGPDTVRPKR